MRQTRLYLDTALVKGAEISLDLEQQNYVRNVLRLKQGATVILFNGDANEYPATVDVLTKKIVSLTVNDCVVADIESPLQIHLGQAITKGDRMDLSIQKAVELGVQEITPLFSEHSVVSLKGDRLERKLAHWQKVANAATEQCGRTRITTIHSPQALAKWLQMPLQDNRALRLMASPTAEKGITDVVSGAQACIVLVGPEGGWSEGEQLAATNLGFMPFSMGPRVLRAETATMAIVAALQVTIGDMK